MRRKQNTYSIASRSQRRHGKRTRRSFKSCMLKWLVLILVAGGLYGLWHQFLSQPHIDYAYFNQLAIQYDKYYIENQDSIMQSIQEEGISPEKVGHLFIPDSPAAYPDIAHIDQLAIPYYNQNDPRWANASYGTDSSRALWENGCAIVALAMVDAYYRGATTPLDILEWAGNEYYVHEQGTSWNIYSDFGQAFGYQVVNLQDDIHVAMNYVQSGYPVVVAVGPGAFTQMGHVMVMRGFDGSHVYLNDPNDSPEHFWSIRPVDPQLLLESNLNYWVFIA